MDTISRLAEKYSDKLKYLILAGASIGLINTFCRADYNFILYLYMFYVWMHLTEDQEIQTREKITIFYILFYSLFIDIIWCFFWKSQWGYLKEDIESGTHGLVIFLSWVGILLKVIIGLIIVFSEKNIMKGALPKKLGEKLNNGYSHQLDEPNEFN
jgi:hypothetical protein